MVQAAVNPYLRTKVMTATPEELRLMLYDGAIKFCRQGRAAIEAKKFDESYHNLMRAQKIVLELSTSLKHSVEPDLCGKLSALYTFIYRKLVDANMERTLAPIDEAVKLLEYERETWQMLMQKLTEEGGSPRAAQPAPTVAPAPVPPSNPLAQPRAMGYNPYSRSA